MEDSSSKHVHYQTAMFTQSWSTHLATSTICWQREPARMVYPEPRHRVIWCPACGANRGHATWKKGVELCGYCGGVYE